MALIVQKYGGTSVGSVARIHAVAEQVASLRAQGHQVAVVVSAMGDSTDRLLDLARQLSPTPASRELDALLATGEMVSCALLAMALCDRGWPAKSYNALQLPLTTSGVHGRARIEGIECAGLRADCSAGVIPVFTGFQGRGPDGSVTTIGRGVVPDARRLDRISFEEMLEMAGQGSRVLHLRSVEFAARYGVRLRVLSSFRPGPGTLICEEDTQVEAPVVAGIAFNRDEAEITVSGLPDRPGVAHALLEPVAAESIEVDMIVVNAPREGRVDFTFTVHRDDYGRACQLVAPVAAGLGAAVRGDDRVAKLAVVGSGMRSHAGVASRVFATLAQEGINVRLVSTSEIKISVLVAEQELERAARALHAAFGLSGQSSGARPLD